MLDWMSLAPDEEMGLVAALSIRPKLIARRGVELRNGMGQGSGQGMGKGQGMGQGMGQKNGQGMGQQNGQGAGGGGNGKNQQYKMKGSNSQ